MKKYLASIKRFFTCRCGFCGKRFKLIYSPIEIGFKLYHWGHCANVMAVCVKKKELEVFGAHTQAVRAREMKFEPYYGCYPWWRMAVLGEDLALAEFNALGHVQRSIYACPTCEGEQTLLVSGIDPGDGQDIVWISVQCPDCEGAGHRRVEDPITADMIP